MKQAAYYYPAPYWAASESGWIKTLLLFFDEVDILLPAYMYGQHHAANPSMTYPLEELGLLRVIEPESFVTGGVASKLTEVLVDLLTDGTFDDLEETKHFQELSQSRMGYSADIELAEMLVDELVERGLARPTEDGVSIPLHPQVRTVILVLLAQLARTSTVGEDLELHPATNHAPAIADMMRLLGREPLPSAQGLVALDLEPVAFDLDPVPLEEVLEFRSEYGASHQAYMRDLRRFLAELSATELGANRDRLLLERRQELADSAHDLQRNSRSALGVNLSSFSLGISGAAWSLATGDPIGLAIGTAGLVVPQVVSAALPESPTVTAYSYLFDVRRRFS